MSDLGAHHPVNREEISRILRERGASQAALAKAMGLKQPAVSQILSGKRRVASAELPVFAAFLGIGITDALRLLGIKVEEAA
jgi:transcriptional regulator with XRE-family HTH domain